MKDMSVEELLDDLCFYADLSDEHYKIQAEILRRYEELEKENEGLRCCGNCKHSYSHCYGSLMCKKLDQSTGRGGYCSNWTTDGLSLEEREK
jgi:hypothetical protein